MFKKQFFKSVRNIDLQDTSNVTIPENITKIIQEFINQVVEKRHELESMLENILWCHLLHHEVSVTVALADDKNAMLRDCLQEKLEELKLNSINPHKKFKIKVKSYKMISEQTCTHKWWTFKSDLLTRPVAVLVISY